MKLRESFIKILLLFIVLSGCSAKVETTLTMDTNATGSHILQVELDQAALDESKIDIDQLNGIIKQYCPSSITCKTNKESDTYQYTFELSFDSIEDYKNKVQALVGDKQEVDINYQTPDNVFSKGFLLSEDFNTKDMSKWFVDVVNKEGIHLDVNKLFQNETVKVIYDGKEYKVYSNNISVNELKTRRIDRIDFYTTINEDNSFHQVIHIYMPKKDYEEGKSELEAFFQKVTPKDATSKWTEEDKSAIFNIAFDATDIASFNEKLNQVFATETSKITWSEQEGPHAFSTYKSLEGTVDLSGYGITSSNQVKVYYQLEAPETLTILNRSIGSQKEYTQSHYENQIELSYSLEQKLPIADFNMVTRIQNTSDIEKVFQLTFQAGLSEDEKNRINEYVSTIAHATLNILKDDPYTVEITFKGEVKSVNESLDIWLGNENTFQLYKEDGSLLKDHIIMNENMNLEPLRTLFNYKDEIHYTIEMPQFGEIQIAGSSDTFVDVNDKKVDTEIKQNYMSYGIRGTIYKVSSILICLFLGLSIIPVLFIVWLFLLKRYAKANGIEYTSWKHLIQLYGKKTLVKIKLDTKILFKDLLHSEDLFIPKNVNKEFYKYFYGSRWDFVLFCISFILCMIALIWNIKELYVVIVLMCCIAVLLYELSTRQKHVRIERNIDEAINLQFTNLLDQAMLKTGISKDEMKAEPYQFTGAYVKLLTKQRDKHKWYKAILYWFQKQLHCLSTQVLKVGQDGMIRCSISECTYLFFTKDTLYVYEYRYDVILNDIYDETVTELYYDKINVIKRIDYIDTVINGKRLKNKKLHYVSIISKSGIQVTFTYLQDQGFVDERIMRMNHLMREKREERKNGRAK